MSAALCWNLYSHWSPEHYTSLVNTGRCDMLTQLNWSIESLCQFHYCQRQCWYQYCALPRLAGQMNSIRTTNFYSQWFSGKPFLSDSFIYHHCQYIIIIQSWIINWPLTKQCKVDKVKWRSILIIISTKWLIMKKLSSTSCHVKTETHSVKISLPILCIGLFYSNSMPCFVTLTLNACKQKFNIALITLLSVVDYFVFGQVGGTNRCSFCFFQDFIHLMGSERLTVLFFGNQGFEHLKTIVCAVFAKCYFHFDDFGYWPHAAA